MASTNVAIRQNLARSQVCITPEPAARYIYVYSHVASIQYTPNVTFNLDVVHYVSCIAARISNMCSVLELDSRMLAHCLPMRCNRPTMKAEAEAFATLSILTRSAKARLSSTRPLYNRHCNKHKNVHSCRPLTTGTN